MRSPRFNTIHIVSHETCMASLPPWLSLLLLYSLFAFAFHSQLLLSFLASADHSQISLPSWLQQWKPKNERKMKQPRPTATTSQTMKLLTSPKSPLWVAETGAVWLPGSLPPTPLGSALSTVSMPCTFYLYDENWKPILNLNISCEIQTKWGCGCMRKHYQAARSSQMSSTVTM